LGKLTHGLGQLTSGLVQPFAAQKHCKTPQIVGNALGIIKNVTFLIKKASYQIRIVTFLITDASCQIRNVALLIRNASGQVRNATFLISNEA